MKTNIQNTFKNAWVASKAAVERNAHTLAASLCGIVMGVLFASNVGLFHAKHFQGQLVTGKSRGTEALSESPASAAVRVVKPALHGAAEESSESSQSESSNSSTEALSSSDTSLQESNSPNTQVEVRNEAPSAPNEAVPESSSSLSQETVPESSSSLSSERSVASEDFPPFQHTSFPVANVPNWGAMRTPDEWNRTYKEMATNDFVSIPRYDMTILTTSMESLIKPLRNENIPLVTAKLFYSTRFFGRYDLDASEFTGTHAGIDLKLARGTPIGAIAGGRVSSVSTSQIYGLHVIIEHRLQSGETFYSIYGHLDAAFVQAGEDVIPGTSVGTIGMTGNTTAPHLHLQIDRGAQGESHHIPYLPASVPSSGDAAPHVVHPMNFIAQYRNGE